MPRERPVHDERRMSDLEAMMWNVEKDPHLSSTFGSLTIFDSVPDFGRIMHRCAYVVSTIPRLRQRVAPALGRLAPPEWVEDDEFDLEFHVRRTALPTGSTLADLLVLAPRLVADPFDRTRPLWEFHFIEGLEDGRAAMLQKMHHTITDGEGGVRMSERLVDLAADSDDPDPVAHEPSPAAASNIFESTIETIGHELRRNAGIARRTAAWLGETAGHPDRWAPTALEAAETARSATRQLLVTDGAHSPLWAERTLQRWFGILDVPFDESKATAKALGGSLNDFFVAGAALAAGAYHRHEGTEVDELRMAMPVSFRTDGSAGGNAFAPMRVLLPTAATDPVDCFEQVRDRLTETKTEKAIGVVSGLSGLLNVLPTSVLVRFARQQVETIDFTTSNVRAAPFDLYIGGARIAGNYPLGPLGGTAFNLTMMSYSGRLNMGLHVDGGAVDRPALLKTCLEEAYDSLLAAG